MRRQSLQRVKTPARAILEAAAAVFFVIIHDGPSDGWEYTLPNTAIKTVFQIKRSISWEFYPHPYPYFCEKSGLPETSPHPCSIKQLVSWTLLDGVKWAEIHHNFSKKCSGNEHPPFADRARVKGFRLCHSW